MGSCCEWGNSELEILDAVPFVPISTWRLQVKHENQCPGGIDPAAER